MPEPPLGRNGRTTRWGILILTIALVALNAWWLWGDWSPSAMKAIDALIARGQLDEAELALGHRLRWSSHDGEARMKRARLLVKKGENLAGARELDLVPFWWPAKSEASFLSGQTFKLAHRARDAEAAWRACLVDDPLHPVPSPMFHGAAKELVTLYVIEGRLDDARKVLWRAYDESSPAERSGVLATRVRAELERIEHQEAIEWLIACVDADPADLAARRALALEEHATGDEASADLTLEACFRIQPDDPLSWRARLEILNDRGDVEAFSQAIARLPSTTLGDARVWMYRGLELQRAGDPAKALEAFRHSARLDPNDAEVVYKLGMAELAVGQVDEGRRHVARTRQLREAYDALRDGYQEFIQQVRKPTRDEAGYRSAIGRLADACRGLGWPREADAWLAQTSGK